jgi:hypothetical protein
MSKDGSITVQIRHDDDLQLLCLRCSRETVARSSWAYRFVFYLQTSVLELHSNSRESGAVDRLQRLDYSSSISAILVCLSLPIWIWIIRCESCARAE